jgi:hypothetical protein
MRHAKSQAFQNEETWPLESILIYLELWIWFGPNVFADLTRGFTEFIVIPKDDITMEDVSRYGEFLAIYNLDIYWVFGHLQNYNIKIPIKAMQHA